MKRHMKPFRQSLKNAFLSVLTVLSHKQMKNLTWPKVCQHFLIIIGFGSIIGFQWQILILYFDILDNYVLQTLCQQTMLKLRPFWIFLPKCRRTLLAYSKPGTVLLLFCCCCFFIKTNRTAINKLSCYKHFFLLLNTVYYIKLETFANLLVCKKIHLPNHAFT